MNIEDYLIAAFIIILFLFIWFYYRVNRKKMQIFEQQVCDLKVDRKLMAAIEKEFNDKNSNKQNKTKN